MCYRGTFNDYADKTRWVAGPKGICIFVHVHICYFDLFSFDELSWRRKIQLAEEASSKRISTSEFFGNFLGIVWELFGNSLGTLSNCLGMYGWGVLIFGIFLRILWEFYQNSLGILLKFLGNFKLHTDTKLSM